MTVGALEPHRASIASILGGQVISRALLALAVLVALDGRLSEGFIARTLRASKWRRGRKGERVDGTG